MEVIKELRFKWLIKEKLFNSICIENLLRPNKMYWQLTIFFVLYESIAIIKLVMFISFKSIHIGHALAN